MVEELNQTTEMYMKGCYFFHGDLANNKSKWSKNSGDRFDVQLAQENSQKFWEWFLHPDDYFLFKKFFEGERQQISGDFRCRQKNQDYEWMHCVLQREEDSDSTLYSGFFTDLSLGYSTMAVTRMRETNGFYHVLQRISQEDTPYGMLVIGIDNFKNINEIYSYAVGDEVIRMFAQRIESAIHTDASLYQLDGDNFGILFPQGTLEDMKICFKTIQQISQYFLLSNGIQVSFTISGGISLYPQDGQDGETLFRNTRVAYNEAKKRGKDQCVVFDQEISLQTTYQAKLMECLRDSVLHEFEGFSLVYQPIVYANDEHLFGCEVLLRWEHPDFPQKVGPADFVPLLERSGLIIEVGKWILEEALKQRKAWNAICPNLHMSINVAEQQFRDNTFIAFVMDMIEKYEVDPSLLALELTESGEIKDVDQINRVFDFFRSQRIRIALDDFGTGYDSLNCLRLLSSDILKIDRSFLERITYNISDQKILHNIINLCNSMKMDVCIEGIETQQVKELTKQLGATLLQGYFYSRPVNAATFLENFILKQAAQSTHVPNHQKESLVYSDSIPAQAKDMSELVEHAYAGIFQVGMDHEFTFLTCNEGYRRMLGYTAKEIEEKFANKALGFVYPDDVEYVGAEIRRQLGIGDTVTAEFRIVLKDGSVKWVIGTGNVMRNADGNPSIVVVIVDNDENKRKQLKEHELCMQYQRILENIPGGIKCVRYDADFTIDYLSPSLLSILGFEERDVENIFQGKYINMVYEEDVVKVMGDVMDQLQSSNVVTLRYRSICKDGSYVWLETISQLAKEVDEDGIQRFYSSIINVTDVISDEEKQRTSQFKERYQLAAERWGDILFEYDLSSQYIAFSENYRTLLGRENVRKFEEEVMMIHEDDRQLLLDTMQECMELKKVQPIELRCQNGNGEFIWCSLFFDEPDMINGTPVMLIGKINIIDAEKKERDRLIIQSELDSLTKLLNKGTLEARIRATMTESPTQPYALYMMDVDDFKKVNDEYGHLFGDRLLQEVAMRLKQLFPEDAIIGRAGGDEFLIFTPWNNDLEDLVRQANQLLNSIKEPISYQGHAYAIKSSIGISCFPKDGEDFFSLFRKADSALYRVKLQNKNDFCIY